MISTKGRYSVRILLDLAQHSGERHIPINEIAQRQDISLHYIEKLMPVLKEAGLVESIAGIGGGYRLARRPEQCSLFEILSLAEDSLAPVACLRDNAEPCGRREICRTLPVWQGFYQQTKEYFSGITLADLMEASEMPEASEAPETPGEA